MSSNPRPTMYASYIGTIGRTLESDDRQALQCAQQRYPVAGGNFYTVRPCRAIDTRSRSGPYGGPGLTGNAVRGFSLAARCGIPPSAKAIVANVTVVGTSSTGYLALFPSGVSRPGTSTVNFLPGRTRANNMILPLGQEASFTAFCSSGAAHLLLDTVGYFD